MHLAFGEKAEVAHAGEVGALGGAEFFKDRAVGGRGGEVDDFVAVGREIVEFLGSLGRAPEDGLRVVGFAGVESGAPHAGRGGLELIRDPLGRRDVGEEIPQVNVAAVGDGADKIQAFVHTAAGAVKVGLGLGLKRAGESVALHRGGRLDPREAQHGGREIDEADEAVGLAAGLILFRGEVPPLLREVDDHGDVQAGVGGPAFAAGHAAAVVAVVKDDRILGEAGGGEFFEADPGVGVGGGDLVVILRPILANLGEIGVVGGDAHLRRIGDGVVRPGANLALVAFLGIEHGEERLAGGTIFPVRLFGGNVPRLGGFGDVVILLGVVGGVVAGLAKVVRIELRAVGERHHGAHVNCAGTLAVEAGGDGGAGGSADGVVGPSLFEDHALCGEGIDVGRAGVGVAVATHLGSVVFAREPENVGAVGGRGGEGNQECKREREQAGRGGK